MSENFSGLVKNIILHIKSSVDPSGINADKTTPKKKKKNKKPHLDIS